MLGCSVLLFPTIFWPFDYDQGTFAYGGWAVLHGLRPYIDFWDIKPPNIFYTYAAAFSVFGNSVRAIRILDYLNALVCIGLLYELTLRLWREPWSRVAAIFAALAFIVQYYIFGSWNTAQTETYSIPFLLGAMLLIVPRNENSHARGVLRPLLAGIFIGISFYFKFPNVLFGILVAAAIWFYNREERWKSIGWLVAGCVAAIGIESAYLALAGELAPLWKLTTSETASYVSSNYSGSFTILRNIRTSLEAIDLLWVLAALLGWILWFFRKKESNSFSWKALGLSLLGCFLALVIVQAENKGYTYHYGILLPWADLLIGVGIANLIVFLARLDRLPVAPHVAAFSIFLIVGSFLWSSRTPLEGRMNELIRIANGSERPNGYVAGDSIADYVSAHTAPKDRIFIFGFQPYVYWKTGRQPASKFINTIHFKPAHVPPEERAELLHDLIGNPPQLFLVETQDRYTSQGNTDDDSRTTIRLRYPELEQLLDDQYTPADTIQQTIIYRKRHGLTR